MGPCWRQGLLKTPFAVDKLSCSTKVASTCQDNQNDLPTARQLTGFKLVWSLLPESWVWLQGRLHCTPQHSTIEPQMPGLEYDIHGNTLHFLKKISSLYLPNSWRSTHSVCSSSNGHSTFDMSSYTVLMFMLLDLSSALLKGKKQPHNNPSNAYLACQS